MGEKKKKQENPFDAIKQRNQMLEDTMNWQGTVKVGADYKTKGQPQAQKKKKAWWEI